MKNLQQWAAVQELHKKKVPIAQIARQLKMSRNTVKKLIKLKEEPQYTRTHYPSKLEDYIDQITEWYTSADYEFNGTRIFRELQKLGYTGTINPVYRILTKINKNSTSEISKLASVRIETPPGDQAQFDWSPYDMWIGNRMRTVYCFTMILSASRKKAMCFSLNSNSDSIYEAIQELFFDLGGVTLELLIDNPKSLVIENNPRSEDEIRYNPEALLVAAHLGTELNACNCYWPRTKGKVERPYQYIEEQFIKGQRFSCMEELNLHGKQFIQDWNNQIHGTTKRIPNEFFENQEKKALLTLPNTKFRLSPLTKRVISNDSFIHINTNKYSVPVKYATKTLLFRLVYGYRIEVYSQSEDLLLTLEAVDGRHKTTKNEEHYEPIAPKANKSIPQIKRDFTRIFKNGEEYLSIASNLYQQPTYHARKILELTDLYDAEDLDLVLAYAIEHSRLDIVSFKRLLKEQFFEIVLDTSKVGTTKIDNSTNHAELTRSCDYYEMEEVTGS